VTRGQLPQKAGSLGLNGGGAAAAVPPNDMWNRNKTVNLIQTNTKILNFGKSCK